MSAHLTLTPRRVAIARRAIATRRLLPLLETSCAIFQRRLLIFTRNLYYFLAQTKKRSVYLRLLFACLPSYY